MSAYLGRALQDIYDQHLQLTAALVVEAARPKDSPLHHRFEWDNKLAGPLYRLQQGGALIRSVKIVRDEQEDCAPVRVRAFLHVPAVEGQSEDDTAASYVPVAVVAASPTMDALVRQEMQRRIRELRRTYGEYDAFWDELRLMVSTAA